MRNLKSVIILLIFISISANASGGEVIYWAVSSLIFLLASFSLGFYLICIANKKNLIAYSLLFVIFVGIELSLGLKWISYFRIDYETLNYILLPLVLSLTFSIIYKGRKIE